MIFGNSQLSIEHEKSKFSILFLKNRNLPTVRFSCFLDQFISTFSHRNHSAKFRGLKLSTKKPCCKLFWNAQYGDEGWDKAGRKFYGLMLKAVQGVDFTKGEWQKLWKEFWLDEKKEHTKKGEDKGNKKSATEEVEVGDLWDDDDNSEMEEMNNFKITMISAV